MDSFAAFYEGTSRRLMRFAYAVTGDLEQAQDFTQEAYARAWQRWRRVQRYQNQEAWLRLVVSRLATDRWRRIGIRQRAPQPAVETAPPPDENFVVLVAALKKIPVEQRRVLALHYLLDRSLADIAVEIGTNVNTIKSRLSRGRASLASALGDVSVPEVDHVR